MSKRNKYCYIAFFVLLSLGFLSILSVIILEIYTSKLPPKCYNPKIQVSDDFQFGNVTISKEDFEKVNETHFSVCLEKKVPVLRKCCPEKEILNITEKETSCAIDENHFETEIKVYDGNNRSLPQYNLSNFYRQYGKISCPNDFKFLSSDSLIFHCDGRLFVRKENEKRYVGSDEFCLDIVKDENNQSSYVGGLVCSPKKQSQWYLTLYAGGSIISVTFFLAVFLSFALIKELRTLHGIYVMNHTASLSIFYIFLSIVQIGGLDLYGPFCRICGFTILFSFLAAFFWLNVMSADIWWSVKNLRPVERRTSSFTKKELKKILFCCLYGWGGPGIILLLSLIREFQPNVLINLPKPRIGENGCIINPSANKEAVLAYLYGPVAILIGLNLYFFISTAREIFFIKKETRKLYGKNNFRNTEENQEFAVYFKLFLAMGINWLMELLSWSLGGPHYIWIIPDFSNSLQGVYIFMIYFPKINKVLLKKFRPGQFKQNDSNSKSNSVSSSNTSKNNDEIKVPMKGVKCSNTDCMDGTTNLL